jgi:hypothetical protein
VTGNETVHIIRRRLEVCWHIGVRRARIFCGCGP